MLLGADLVQGFPHYADVAFISREIVPKICFISQMLSWTVEREEKQVVLARFQGHLKVLAGHGARVELDVR